MIAVTVASGLSGCKSHKKVQSEDVIAEKTIKKKDKKKTKTLRQQLIDEAMTWIGTPYKYARQEKGSGTDCSGFTMVVYNDVANIKIPRNSAKQAEYCKSIKNSEIEPGDLVFFATGKDKNRVSHVGMMIDSDKFIHASSSKGVVISDINQNYYKRTFIKFGRVPSM